MLHHDRNHIAALEADRLREAARRRSASEAHELGRIVRAAGRGDASAWSALVARYRARVTRVARSQGLTAHEADDVAQETWLRLYRNLRSIREPLSVGAWLETTARRESYRTLQTLRREPPTDDALLADEAALEDPELELLRERRDAVEVALERLPERHRRLMRTLLSETEPSYAELSAQLGIPIGSIGPIRGRCVEALRRVVAPERC